MHILKWRPRVLIKVENEDDSLVQGDASVQLEERHIKYEP